MSQQGSTGAVAKGRAAGELNKAEQTWDMAEITKSAGEGERVQNVLWFVFYYLTPKQGEISERKLCNFD